MANLLVTELMNVQELAKKLETHLSDTPPELCKSFLEEIQTALNRVISLVKPSSDGEDSSNAFVVADQDRRESSRKRNKQVQALPRWNKQVQAPPGSSADRPPEDGFSWRKYGQKEILRSSFPRGYYRCTNKYTHNCPALKQAQRSDENPTIFNVVYKGEHVCVQRSISPPSPAQGRSFFLEGGGELTVITQGFVGSPSFSSSPTPLSCMSEIPLFGPFPASSALAVLSFSGADTTHFTANESFHGSNHVGAWEHDRGDMLSGDTSATSSPAIDFGIFLDADFGDNFFP